MKGHILPVSETGDPLMRSLVPAQSEPTRGRWAVKAYRPFVASLRELVATSKASPETDYEALLDGAAARELRSTVPLARRRRMGAFFTGSGLASRALRELDSMPHTVFDPACGAGDLLLTAASRFPIQRSASATLADWGRRLAGFDLVPEFVQAAHMRLTLLAMERTHDRVDPAALGQLLPDIRCGNGIKELRRRDIAGLLFINPPFGQMPAPKGQGWCINKITKAAVFLQEGVKAMDSRARLVAILPDVIRSGSGYSSLREWLGRQLDDITVIIAGRFDPSTDVDVFVLIGKKRASPSSAAEAIDWYQVGSQQTASRSVGDSFDVHVGKVVEYRDEGKARDRPFVTAGNLRPWTVMQRLHNRWGAGNQVTLPPFVAIRRTSSPDDSYRALAAVVAGGRPVAVENHLITARPRSGSLDDAIALMNWLRSEQVNAVLQRRIRCRHLTLASIRELPWV